MGMFTSINIASTGMAAERLRSDVIILKVTYLISYLLN